jgi:hypothetical protein
MSLFLTCFSIPSLSSNVNLTGLTALQPMDEYSLMRSFVIHSIKEKQEAEETLPQNMNVRKGLITDVNQTIPYSGSQLVELGITVSIDINTIDSVQIKKEVVKKSSKKKETFPSLETKSFENPKSCILEENEEKTDLNRMRQNFIPERDQKEKKHTTTIRYDKDVMDKNFEVLGSCKEFSSPIENEFRETEKVKFVISIFFFF